MDERLNMLIADSDSSGADRIGESVRAMGHDCTVVVEAERAIDEVRSGAYEVIVMDLRLGGEDGAGLPKVARAARPDCQVIVLADKGSVTDAVTAMQQGAMTYLQKPVNPLELNAVIDRAAEHISLERDRAALRREVLMRYGFENIIGSSRGMMKVFESIRRIAPTDATVLITGETGTGKELVARAIHYNSPRRNNRFVPLNCAGLVQSILESELFGHEKGAFTNATKSRIGLFEYANHGALFLDEIGDMPLSSQVKLLRVLEHGEIVRVGSNEPVKVDVRLIAATHGNLQEKVNEGSFREDLFYRLNVVTVHLPPLRQREGDIALLIDYYVRHFRQRYGKDVQGLSPEARKVLSRHHWPGNVRELKNCIEHMVVLTRDEVLDMSDLPDSILEQSGKLLREPSLDSLVGQPLDEVEKYHIQRTLEQVDGNRERAADLLGIGERTLYRKIQKYGLR